MKKKYDLQNLFSDNPKVKYACSKELIALSKEKPGALYGDFDFFEKLLSTNNQIIKWSAIDIIGNLSKADKEHKVEDALPTLISFLNRGKVITAGHATMALAEIAKNKPKYQERIINEFLKVEHYNFNTKECQNIAVGRAILALKIFPVEVLIKKPVKDFLRRHVLNTRPATAKKAKGLLQVIEKSTK